MEPIEIPPSMVAKTQEILEAQKKKRRLILFCVGLTIFIAVGVLAVLAVQKRINLNTPPSPLLTPSPSTTPTPSAKKNLVQLTILPSQITTAVDKTINLQIKISAPTSKISGVELYILFDPKVFSVEKIEAGQFFNQPAVLLKEIEKTKGIISYALGSLQPQKGEGILATLTLKVQTTTPAIGSSINFSNQTKVADIGINGQNALSSTTGTIITVQ